MIYKIILSYLAGIIFEVKLQPDFYSDIFILISGSIFFYLYSCYKGHRFSIKDTQKNMSFIVLFAVFFLSILYTRSKLETVSYQNFNENIFSLVGNVVEVKHQNSLQEILLRVESMTNLNNSQAITNYPKHITISVSPFQKYDLYDKLEVVGTVELKNFNIYNDYRPMFFTYEQEKFLNDSNYIVSHPKQIEIKKYDKNFYETVISLFHQLSIELKKKISEHMPEPYAGISNGVSLGDQEYILREIKDTFRTSGLIHILVLSGANVAFIITIFNFILRRTRNVHRVISVTFFSWIFILLTGFTAPSVRAGVMSNLNIFAEFFQKNMTPLQALLLSLFVLTILDPLALIYSPSLHLTFLACFGLFCIVPELEKKFFKKNFLNYLFSISIAMFITIVPYILALTGKSSIFGTLLTFVVEPFVATTTVLSFLIIVSSFINSYLADFLGILNTLSTKAILFIATLGAENFPILQLHVPVTFLIIFYVGLFLVFFNKAEML